MEMLLTSSNSYWNWACCLQTITGLSVSKQAIFCRMNTAWVETVKALVREVIAAQANKQIKHPLFKKFKSVWIQDSTCLHLPEILFEKFRCKIMEGEKKAVAKLNIIVNAISGCCPIMEWESFTVSEVALSKRILHIAKAGELVIRDLGYFSLGLFKTMNAESIYFLSRYRPDVCLYDIRTGAQIELLKLLKGKPYIDQYMLCGRDEQLKARFVAMKISPEQANERRRKAKKHHRNTTNHGKEYYALLDYLFFIANVEQDTWNYKELCEAYRIRWNVEILFKSWKSGLKIKEMIPEARTHTDRVESILYLLLLYIAWFQLLVYLPIREWLEKKNKYLSIIRVAKWIKAHSLDWLKSQITNNMKEEIEYYCCYDTRRRINTGLRLAHFLTLLT
jgi:DDE family transposase